MITYELIFSILKIGIICFSLNLPFGMIRSRFTSYWYVFIFMAFGIAGQILGKKIALKYFPPK